MLNNEEKGKDSFDLGQREFLDRCEPMGQRDQGQRVGVNQWGKETRGKEIWGKESF